MSAHIRARKHLKASQLATLVALAIPAVAQAEEASTTLPTVKVEAAADVPYKATVSANPKYTQPLLDTPQTISVIKKETFLEQGAATLMEALRNTPGITTQLGENGNTSVGDAFTMRGVSSSQNAVFVDGLRDMGAITRDVYNVEQVEVVKGAAGGDIGRGAGAGYINLISKLPSLENATTGTASINTGQLKRSNVDFNRKIGDSTAVRLNAMAQDGGVDGRDYVNNRGWAFAPSVGFGLGTDTRVFAYAQFVEQNNRPDGGISAIGVPGYVRPVTTGATAATAQQAAWLTAGARVDRNTYYGNMADYEKVSAYQATFKVEHDLAGGGTLRNITRVGHTAMDRVLGSPGATLATSSDPATWTINISRQGVAQTNEIVVNQTTLNKTFDSGFLVQDVVAGVELMSERQRTETLSAGTATTVSNLYNPDPNLPMAIPTKTGAFTDGRTNTVAVYANDTFKLGSAWQLSAGVRAEHYSTTTAATSSPTTFDKSDWLYSWKTGAVYKPAANGSIYVAVANSMNPPGGGNFALAAGNTNSSNSTSLDPQQTMNKEIGTKWDLLDKKLAVTAAYYNTSIRNEQPVLDPISNTYLAAGDRKIKGIELGAVGALTDKWYLSAGVATMDTKVTSGPTTGNNAVGAAARFSPDLTGTLWTTYNTGVWSAGIGARYTSEQKLLVSPGTAPTGVPSIPSATVFDAMASYQLSKNLTIRVNLYNLTDKFYIASLNNGGNRVTLGAPRSGTLTAAFQF
ncbi:MAG TPA: TonB-dependent siderophore receptor [Rhodocyclaceae bacterium]|nr:TonB-dependent siderophore receptor [Rhodocyclaceae bacterium]